MNDLLNIIKKYGSPKAIIDYPNKNNLKKIILDFSDIVCINADNVFLINNEKKKGDCLKLWQEYIDIWKADTKSDDIAAIGFFSYDFKNLIYPGKKFKKYKSRQVPYLWFAKPKNIIEIEDYSYNSCNQKMILKKDIKNIIDFEKIINKIKDYLYLGDTYQINYTQPISFDFFGDPLSLYMKIKETANPKYGVYLDVNRFQFLSFSPEKFFIKNKTSIETYPIKGTISKSNIEKDDKIQIKKLFNSEKDRAEHLMIVDLLRNDIGKISKFGTVKVEKLFSIETFETIHHMVSKIVGNIRDEVTEIDIIKALFPGGSITGAPKFKSVQIIDDIEEYNRGIYTGSIGTINGNGDMDFNICIRTMTINNNRAIYPVGGGIVWDSEPQSEYSEAKNKANILEYYNE
ncbi:MAG: aminodeoxychorismate synthase, component I [Candidatus Marinimicrobia bacterium]|nr:aminodeoxychorismate synthase, component I [Candidatus Neomarinimicrobiota bacterium]|tara:strand:- start:13396 stop:14601 length:1206 start_codon:yes stop_codon:yes gene_type:complete